MRTVDREVDAVQTRWEQGVPPLEVAEQVAGSGAHFDMLTSETNGLGAPGAA